MKSPPTGLLLLLVWFCSIITQINGVQSAASPLNVSQLHRTAYHFQPPKNWINDPNGPMYYNGIYHLFYQYNPQGATWGNILWAHSISKDLINWQSLEPAIYPSKPFDQFGCWSGSATILPGNRPVIVYTGIVDSNMTQVQNYAVPANLSDPYLRKWIKPDNNPIIAPDSFIIKTSFRDPTTAWVGNDGGWRISVGGQRKGRARPESRPEEASKIREPSPSRGIAYLYRSMDFMHWIKAKHPLHSVAGTGNWECPDFFPVAVTGRDGVDGYYRGGDVRHVLKASLDATKYDYYTIGTYLYSKDRYLPSEGMIDGWNGLRYDYGNFYASKSFFDSRKKRRVLWGWANESDSKDDDITKGWAGIQLIPRTLWMDPSGKQLLQWPIEEVESLRGKKMELNNETLVKGQVVEIQGITTAQADVDVVFSFESLDKAEPFDSSWDRYDAQKICGQRGSMVEGGLGPFGLLTLASKKLEEYTPVFFRVFKDQEKYLVLMCSDASRSSLNEGPDLYKPSYAGFVNVDLSEKKLALRSLIDNSVVESFGEGGKTCISSRVYPTLAIYENSHLYAFNNGSQSIKIDNLKAWSMNRPIHMNTPI